MSKYTPRQIQMMAAGWSVFTLIVGVCAFFGIYYIVGGFESAGQSGGSPQAGATGEGGDLFGNPTQPVGAGGGSEPVEATPAPPQYPLSDDAFAFGGQEPHGGIPNSEAMRSAGMTWVKLQAYDLTVDFGLAIENAHNQGLRILVSVKDEANKDLITTPEYQEQLISYMETLATQGADAIEVWNEPNIDREWPVGEISGESYTALLKLAYPRIKAANPDTIVISGAPAPTGYFGGGCSPEGCDDEPYLNEMVAAGAMDYLDCIGLHYNEGILPPTASSGDPRGNSTHYTRYYPTMVETYINATGNIKPLCFTELGYLAGATNPNLAEESPGFAWAADVTVEQQAEWLAQAAQLSRDDPRVQMMIIFNVGIHTTGTDPQDSYAIIRPDTGECSACSALAAVMLDQ